MHTNVHRNSGPLAQASGSARRSARALLVRRAVVACVVPALLAGCYTYRPVIATQPEPGTRVDLHLTDEGRVAVRERIGPEIARVEGALVFRTDTSFLLRMTETHGLFGARTPWSGEEVSVRREYVGLVRERRLDAFRSILAGGAVVGALVLIFGTDLFGIGFGHEDGTRPIPPEPQ